MKAEFIDMAKGRPSHKTVTTWNQMSSLLEESRSREPFLFELVGDQGHTLTVGLAKQVGSVQFAPTNGDSPYLEAVSPGSPPLNEKEARNPYAAAIRADELAGVVPIEFVCAGSATPIPSRYIVPYELVRKIVMDFLQTGQPSPEVFWEEI
jgi:hypothetical protein